MICLDTSAYSHFMRGDRNVLELIVGARQLLIPTIVVGELLYGFAAGGRPRENESVLSEFLGEDVVEVAEVNRHAARHFADIMVELRTRGTPIPTNDVWIAAVAASRGATVVTYDNHFDRISRVASIVLHSEETR